MVYNVFIFRNKTAYKHLSTINICYPIEICREKNILTFWPVKVDKTSQFSPGSLYPSLKKCQQNTIAVGLMKSYVVSEIKAKMKKWAKTLFITGDQLFRPSASA